MTDEAHIEHVVSEQQAAADVEQREAVRSLAMALAPENSTTAALVKGVVTAVDLTANPRTLSAQLSGDTTTTVDAIVFVQSYTPVVGDTCYIIKQGNSILALGAPSVPAPTPAADGWITPTLGTNVTANAFDPVRYRVVVDNGARKVQLRGGVNLSGSPTTLWTMPADARPVVNLTPLVCARNSDTGGNTVLLTPNAAGTMVISGTTTAPTTGTPNESTTGDSSIGVTVNSFVLTSGNHNGHTHWLSDWLGGPPRDFTPSGTDGGHNHSVPAHGHGMAHTHEHSHTHTSTVTAPTLVSLNGLEYFL